MSIENELERIADALWVLVDLKKGTDRPVQKDVAPTGKAEPAPEAPKKVTKAKAEKPVAVEEPVVTETVTEVNKAQIEDVLKKFAAKFGIPTTKALIVQFGADSGTPTIASIPTGRYAELYQACNEKLK